MQVNAPSEGANSIFANIDAEPQEPSMISDILPLTSGFEQRTVTWRGNGTFDNNQFVPKVFNLSQGPHQLIIRGREGNTLFQSFVIEASNSAPMVSPISQNPADAQPNAWGTQVYALSPAQYSGSAVDPNGRPLTWQWIYQINGGPEILFQSGSGTIPTVNFTYGMGATGSNFVWTLRVSNGQLISQSQLNVGVIGPVVTPAGLTIQAPLGIIAAPFIITNGYIYQLAETSVTNGGRAVYNFSVTTAGTYTIQVWVNAPNGGANSLFMNIDAEPEDPFMISDITPFTSGFELRTLNWRGNGTSDNNEFVPQVFFLPQGPHQLIIRGREGNTLLQNFTIFMTGAG
jgi:hypothetical protein